MTCALECVDSEHAKTSTASMVAALQGKSNQGKDLMSPGQAMVAATTFCRRVTLLDVTGLVGDVDIDGEGLAGSTADQGERQEPPLYVELRKLIADNPGVIVDEGGAIHVLQMQRLGQHSRAMTENLNHALAIVRTRLSKGGDGMTPADMSSELSAKVLGKRRSLVSPPVRLRHADGRLPRHVRYLVFDGAQLRARAGVPAA